jgi:hypothetical protein
MLLYIIAVLIVVESVKIAICKIKSTIIPPGGAPSFLTLSPCLTGSVN